MFAVGKVNEHGIRKNIVYICLWRKETKENSEGYCLIYDYYYEEPEFVMSSLVEFIEDIPLKYEKKENNVTYKAEYKELLETDFFYNLLEGCKKQRIFFKSKINKKEIVKNWIKYLVSKNLLKGKYIKDNYYYILKGEEGKETERLIYLLKENKVENMFFVDNKENILKAINLGIMEKYKLGSGDYYCDEENFEFFYDNKNKKMEFFK